MSEIIEVAEQQEQYPEIPAEFQSVFSNWSSISAVELDHSELAAAVTKQNKATLKLLKTAAFAKSTLEKSLSASHPTLSVYRSVMLLEKHPAVKSVKILPKNCVLVLTHTHWFRVRSEEYPNVWFCSAPLVVAFFPSQSRYTNILVFGTRISGPTANSDRVPYPHVMSKSGKICAGTLETPLRDALSRGDLLAAFDLFLSWSSEVNAADLAGAKGYFYPHVISEKRPTTDWRSIEDLWAIRSDHFKSLIASRDYYSSHLNNYDIPTSTLAAIKEFLEDNTPFHTPELHEAPDESIIPKIKL